ncbi:hypothetical protein F4779DRAFT_50039 [Xylariaceae sp. FL0662B]|nr:hypothetical protein F4779DRAFT_50039 [Xylariaceae sp. FL0662B]
MTISRQFYPTSMVLFRHKGSVKASRIISLNSHKAPGQMHATGIWDKEKHDCDSGIRRGTVKSGLKLYCRGTMAMIIFVALFVPPTVLTWTMIAIEHFRSNKNGEVDIEQGQRDNTINPAQLQAHEAELPVRASSQSSRSGTMDSSLDNENPMKSLFYKLTNKARNPAPVELDTVNPPAVETSAPPKIPTPVHTKANSFAQDDEWSTIGLDGYNHGAADRSQHLRATSIPEEDEVETVKSHYWNSL